MDNLELLWCRSIKINEESYGKCVSCSSSEGGACFITDANYVCMYEYSNPDKPITKKIEGEPLRYIRYMAVHDVIFLATDYELILCDRHTLQCNVCCTSDKRIVALAWNPAETAVVIVDENEKIFLYSYSTPTFDCQHSNDLNASVPSSVYVGWGSENTQFRGPKKKGKEEFLVSLIELKHTPPNISWRGNGQLFAINFYKDGQRFIKVFDNQLQPLNVSTEYPNLLEPISFMVAGQCIACTAGGDKNTVVIFEKNCKVKSTFEVAENKGTIVKMQYHPQMNILAVYSLDDSECGYINIYLNANGVWLLKQQLCFPSNNRVQDFQWIDLHESLYTISRLVVFTAQTIEYYSFRFIINRCPGNSIVAVVDGRCISWYDFADKVVPPPMTNNKLQLARPVNKLLFHPQKLFCVVLDSSMRVTVIDLANFAVVLSSEATDLVTSPRFQNIVWVDDKTIEINFEHNGELKSSDYQSGNLTLLVKCVKRGSSNFALPYNDSNCLVAYKSLNVENNTLIYSTKKVLFVNVSEVELDFCLSSNRELLLNDEVVFNGVTSFFVFENYLLLTTVGCKLYCIRLLEAYETLLHNNLDLEKTYSREIEQGARIVTVSSGYPPRIILVLPRGNLETITFRLLTIDILEKLLDENKWKNAVDIMRVERMNWNLLVDLNPQRFSQHIKDFVKATVFCTNLSMIVNDFSNTSISYKNAVPNAPKQECDKTEIIKEIVSYLASTDLISNLSSIVSIQQKHFSLKSALCYIKIVFESNPHANESTCKKALQLLTNKGYFKDILEATYSLYSLDFLMFVYQNSTEDPRIYEPEIAQFRNLKPIELRFKMSLKANNVKEAVKYLLRCDNYNTNFITSFILKHRLEDVAYKSLQPFYDHFSTVSVLYAKRLSIQKKHTEAALVLKRSNLMLEALEEYKEALDWREVLSILTVLKFNEEERRKVLYDLSNKLAGTDRVDDAVLLLDKYINDDKSAIQVLVEHKRFRKAICLAKEREATEMLEELVIPALKSYMFDLKDKIDEFEATFKNYFNRLQSLREEKQIKLDNAALGIYEGGDDDLYSEMGSTVSSYGSSRVTSRSRSSQLSSKNRRKEARKKIDLRQGGYYEDIALIRALHILYGDVFSLGKDVREVCLILDHDDVNLSKSLHSNLSRVQDLMTKRIALIWSDTFLNPPTVLDNTVLAVVENKADLDPIYCVPPGQNVLSVEWRLDMFS